MLVKVSKFTLFTSTARQSASVPNKLTTSSVRYIYVYMLVRNVWQADGQAEEVKAESALLVPPPSGRTCWQGRSSAENGRQHAAKLPIDRVGLRSLRQQRYPPVNSQSAVFPKQRARVWRTGRGPRGRVWTLALWGRFLFVLLQQETTTDLTHLRGNQTHTYHKHGETRTQTHSRGLRSEESAQSKFIPSTWFSCAEYSVPLTALLKPA